MATGPRPRWCTLHHEATVVDAHVHPSLPRALFHRNLNLHYEIRRPFSFWPLDVHASFPDMRTGGYDVAMSVIYVPEKPLLRDFPIVKLLRFVEPDVWHKIFKQSPFKATLTMMGDLEKAATSARAGASMQVAHSLRELDEILAMKKGERPTALIHAVEGAHSLTGPEPSEKATLDNLNTLFDKGVAYLTLAHFYENSVVNPCWPFPQLVANFLARPSVWRDLTLGLGQFGPAVVRRMIDLGMMIDLTHSTPTARQEVYHIVDEHFAPTGKKVPLLATHVGAYRLNPSPYNLQDWEIQRIARDGGFVGVIFMPYWLADKESGEGINFISRTIAHVIKVGGEDVVGIGTDFDGFTTPPDDLDDASQMKRLTQRLVVEGYGEPLIKKILGGNFLRVLHAGWGRTGNGM